MNTNLRFEYPTWFILFCVLVGAAYALLLYYRDHRFHEKSSQLNWWLGGLRFLSVFLISFLLLSPVLRSLRTETQKPIIVLAQDESESVGGGLKDSTAYKNAYNALKSRLSEDYDVKEYGFGERVREGVDFRFKDKISNVSDVLKTVYDLYSSQNLGAIVLATDGIYNEGSNPLYANAKLTVPIYTVALGDTIPKKDLVLKRAFHNKIAYLGDRFSVQVDVTAMNCGGANTILSVSKIEQGQSPRKISDFPIRVTDNDFFYTQELVLDADKSGVQRFRLSVSQVNGEVTTLNNVQDIFIDVLDARQKILVIANSPHPDLAALRQTISKNKNYELTVAFLDNFRENLADFNFVILHQIPSTTRETTALFRQINERKLPRLFIVGSQTNLPIFNKSQNTLAINGNTQNTNQVQPFFGSNFNLFTLDDAFKKEAKRFPPVLAPFGDFRAMPKAQVLLYQKVGSVETEYPLLALGEENGVKEGVLAAEGIWKWRLFDFLQHENHEVFDELLGKSIQYLTLKEDKRKFRVSVDKNIFNENERIFFDAELYNQSYELINEPDVSLKITNADGKDFNYTFNKTEKNYALDAGLFPVGNYTFEGKVTVGAEQLTSTGQFSVRPIQMEVFETTANHGLLRLLSSKFDGSLVYPANFASLADSIKSQNTIKPVFYTTAQTRSIIHLKWIFFLILLLLSVEWFFRRYFGSY